MATRRNHVRLIVWTLVLIAGGLFVRFVAMREPVVDVTSITVSRGRVEDTITAIASGTVHAEQDAMLAAETLGKVTAIHASEGDEVENDAVLIELNHAELDAQVALAEANLNVGRSRLEQARLGAAIYEEVSAAQVAQTTAQLQQAQSDFRRMEALANEGAVSKMELDKAALALKVASEANAGAVATQREGLVRTEEVRLAESALEQLESALTGARAVREKAFIRAPFAGRVAKIYVEMGEAVILGAPVIHLVQSSDIYVQAPFDEANAGEIKPGQKVRINVDAQRARDYFGVVERIAPVVTLNPDLSRSLEIRIRLESNYDVFMPGMSADVIIVAAEKPDVLFVPTEAIVRQTFVYVIDGGKALRRNLKLGVGNWNTTEVLEGLSEGDQVITSISSRDLHEGIRVHVVEELAEP